MLFRELNDDNIVNFAMKNYNNPSCKNIEEFQEDFNRIKYVKRLFNRYETTGVLRERLILNHIITFSICSNEPRKLVLIPFLGMS